MLLFGYFLVTFSLLSGRPPKSLFRYFFVTLNFSGFRALWGLLPLTAQRKNPGKMAKKMENGPTPEMAAQGQKSPRKCPSKSQRWVKITLFDSLSSLSAFLNRWGWREQKEALFFLTVGGFRAHRSQKALRLAGTFSIRIWTKTHWTLLFRTLSTFP